MNSMNWIFVESVNEWYFVERIRAIKYNSVDEFSNIPNECSLNSLTKMINSSSDFQFVCSALFFDQK